VGHEHADLDWATTAAAAAPASTPVAVHNRVGVPYDLLRHFPPMLSTHTFSTPAFSTLAILPAFSVVRMVVL